MDKPCASWAVMVSLATGSAAWRLAPPEVCRRWRRGGVIGTPPFPAPGPATGRRWSRCKVCPGKRSPGRAQNNSSHNEVGTAASLWVHSSQLIHLFLSLYLSVSVCLSINDQVNRKLDSTANFKLIALPLFMGKYMKWKSSGRVKLFLNLVRSIRRSYIRGPKTFAQHVLGTFALLDDHCLWMAESRALLWMKKKKKKWMTVSLGSSLASEEICLFVDLWKAQPLSRRPRMR